MKHKYFIAYDAVMPSSFEPLYISVDGNIYYSDSFVCCGTTLSYIDIARCLSWSNSSVYLHPFGTIGNTDA